jgi:hypothetical protein
MTRKPEIEPLTEARWGRIEQSLMQRLDQMPRQESRLARRASAPTPGLTSGKRVSAKMVAALCAVAAVAAAFAVIVARGAWLAAPVATSRIVTEASASHVTIAETSLDVSPESSIEVLEQAHATVIVLEHGEVTLHVEPRPSDRPLLVEAGDVHVRVVGTELTVRRVGTGAAVRVRRGVIEVRAHGEVATVRAGETWPEEAKPASALIAPSAPEDEVLELPATPAPARAAPAPLAATANANANANANATGRASSVPSVATPASSSPLAAPPQSAPVPNESAQAQYEAAARIERSDPSRALRAYLALARGDDAWAQNALYAAGRLQIDRGARADGARLLDEYLRRFPRGSNAQDARALRESLR